jgi:hypothetical protein
MVADGLFESERIELLEGVIVERSAQDPAHAAAVQRLDQGLQRALGDAAQYGPVVSVRPAGSIQLRASPDVSVPVLRSCGSSRARGPLAAPQRRKGRRAPRRP